MPIGPQTTARVLNHARWACPEIGVTPSQPGVHMSRAILTSAADTKLTRTMHCCFPSRTEGSLWPRVSFVPLLRGSDQSDSR